MQCACFRSENIRRGHPLGAASYQRAYADNRMLLHFSVQHLK